MTMPKDIEELRDELIPRDLNFMCGDTACGASRCWKLGFEAYYKAMQSMAESEFDEKVVQDAAWKLIDETGIVDDGFSWSQDRGRFLQGVRWQHAQDWARIKSTEQLMSVQLDMAQQIIDLEIKLKIAVEALELINKGPCKTMAEPWSVWYSIYSGKALDKLQREIEKA